MRNLAARETVDEVGNLIAGEDEGFNSHFGVSITRLFITLVKDIIYNERKGASTLTQQLARNLFLTLDKTWERKIKEAILTFQIEKRYTKNEILTLYCNHILFGHGTFGVEAASRLYFNKHAKDLKLEEAAMIAGIIQSPARQSPYVNPDRARTRGARRVRPGLSARRRRSNGPGGRLAAGAW